MNNNRPAIVTIVGHIDHGKSTLLKAVRKSDQDLNEHGDITQHIGAYEITHNYEGADRKLTMIDTPGHEAFSHIREHGVDIADIAFLVVSSEEGAKEQTIESYKIIQEKNIPFIIVFTKSDTEKANLEKAKMSVLEKGILLEGLGGDVPYISVSSKTMENISDLIDLTFLTSDLYEITGEAKEGESLGVVIEANMDVKRGIAATVIVHKGKLMEGKYVRAKDSIAPLRIMENDRGKKLDEVSPSTPVKIVGFDKVPEVGSEVYMYDTKKEALAEVENIVPMAEEKKKDIACTIYLIVKTDTAGSLETIKNSFASIDTDKISFEIIKTGIGELSEDDINFANNSDKEIHVIGFHTKVSGNLDQLAQRLGVSLHIFNTIYELFDWSKEVSTQVVKTKEFDTKTGEATIIRIFEEGQGNHIVGIQIKEGSFKVGQKILIQKGKQNVGEYTIETIEQRNQKVEEVEGQKTQFASKIKGEGEIALDYTVLGLGEL